MERQILYPLGKPISITPSSAGSCTPVDKLTKKQFERAVKKFQKEKRKRDRTK